METRKEEYRGCKEADTWSPRQAKQSGTYKPNDSLLDDCLLHSFLPDRVFGRDKTAKFMRGTLDRKSLLHPPTVVRHDCRNASGREVHAVRLARLKQLQYVSVQRGISRRDQVRLPTDVLVAIKRAERSPSFAHARCHGGNIPRVHSWIDRDVNATQAQESVIDAIS